MFNGMTNAYADTETFADPIKRSAWIVYQLRLQGRSLASLARDAGVHRTAPGHALRKPYPKMERTIAGDRPRS